MKYVLTGDAHEGVLVDADGNTFRHTFVKGDLVELTPDQYKAFADRFKPQAVWEAEQEAEKARAEAAAEAEKARTELEAELVEAQAAADEEAAEENAVEVENVNKAARTRVSKATPAHETAPFNRPAVGTQAAKNVADSKEGVSSAAGPGGAKGPKKTA